MDSKLFRLPTNPNFYANISTADPFNTNDRQKWSQVASPDARFPGWAAPMQDGRLVTSYQNHCSQNVPAGRQFATKEWFTRNATDIIDMTRKRLSKQTGAIYGLDASVVPPPERVISYTKSDGVAKSTGMPGGIGTEREPEAVPELFGTWDPRDSYVTAPKPNIKTTTYYEGGRNTPRGPELR